MVEFVPVVVVGVGTALMAAAFLIAAQRATTELDRRKYRVAAITLAVAATVVASVTWLLVAAGPPPS